MYIVNLCSARPGDAAEVCVCTLFTFVVRDLKVLLKSVYIVYLCSARPEGAAGVCVCTLLTFVVRDLKVLLESVCEHCLPL